MRAKREPLDEQALLEKNQKAAKILENNRKKLGTRKRRQRKEYGLGLPYERSDLVSMDDREEETTSNK